MNDDVVTIETPEHVVFEYELAGLGSRLLAALIDAVLVLLAVLGILLITWLVLLGNMNAFGPFAAAAAAVGGFTLFWGYPIAFEIWKRGQTPGKQALGIRVIREGGYALTPAVVIVRNLMRLADFLPAGYFLGFVVMACNRKYQRIGDFVAGTIVVRDRRKALAAATVTTRSLEAPATQAAAAELRRAGAHRLAPEQVRLIEDFLARRRSMDVQARRRIAGQLAGSLAALMGVDGPRGEPFLESLLLAHRQGEEPAPPTEGRAP